MGTTSTNTTKFAPTTHSLKWRNHSEAAHEVHFYTDDSFLLDPLSRFVGTALGAGDGVLVIATRAHREALTQRLIANGLDTGRAIRRGRYVELDAEETPAKFMINGMPDATLFTSIIGSAISGIREALRMDNPNIAAFGEMVALLWKDGNGEAAVRLEQLWNTLAEEFHFSLHCAYPIAEFHREEHSAVFQKICAEHTAVIPDESYTALASEDERFRNIAHLQQREQVYEALRRTKEQLESEVAARMHAEQRLRLSEESLRSLSGDLLRTQDEERRLGRQLHDSVGQYLAAIKMSLDLLKFDVQGQVPGSDQQIAECMGMADKAIAEIRTISYLLYPPMLEEMGLRTAIEWYLHSFAERSKLIVTLNVSSELRRLPRDIELCVFRILQEALANVHRHSGSATAQIQLGNEYGMIRLEIRDQGCGIHPLMMKCAQETVGMLGVGLRGMDERVRQLGGKLELSTSEKGTTVTATIPSS